MSETTQRTGFSASLKGFLRENWLYIAAPFVLIVLALLVLLLLGRDEPGGFLYNLF